VKRGLPHGEIFPDAAGCAAGDGRRRGPRLRAIDHAAFNPRPPFHLALGFNDQRPVVGVEDALAEAGQHLTRVAADDARLAHAVAFPRR